jgi:hypothetical protein
MAPDPIEPSNPGDRAERIKPAGSPASDEDRPTVEGQAPEPAVRPEDGAPEACDYGGVLQYLVYSLSIPERTLRSASGLVGGTLRESAALLVPRAFRSSSTYSIMVQQMLDFMAEDLGGVERVEEAGLPPKVENYVARKTVGNFIEMAGLATLHLSPLTVLAAFSDIAYGSQTYLKELADELKRQGVIDEDSTVHHIDDLLEAVAQTAGTTASAFDTPPLSVEGLQETIRQTREAVARFDPTRALPQSEVERLWNDMHGMAAEHGVNPFAFSGAMTLYSLDKIGAAGRGALSTVRVAGNLFDRHVFDHYREALDEIGQKGLYRAVGEKSKPYIEALWLNFAPTNATITEQVLSGQLFGRTWGSVRRWFGGSE